MDQIRTGQFLKELRNQKGITQEKLADVLGVSNRSVSRWENGNTMPDFDLLIELAKYYSISIDEIIDGKRKDDEEMNKETEETMYKVAEYTSHEKARMLTGIKYTSWCAVLCWIIYFAVSRTGLIDPDIVDLIGGFGFGLTIGIAVVTTFRMKRFREFKRRVLKIG